jgi:uncharacterized membrane protein
MGDAVDIRIAVTLACALIAALSVPLVLGKVRPNHIYGFRTPRTLSSPDIWYRANVFSGKAMLVAMAVTAAFTWIAPDDFPQLFPVFLLMAALLVVLAASVFHLRRL